MGVGSKKESQGGFLSSCCFCFLRDNNLLANEARRVEPVSGPLRTTSTQLEVNEDRRRSGIAHSAFILDNPGIVFDFYDVDKKKIGEGSYGSVCKAKRKDTQQIRAVKTINKIQMKNVERFKMEIAIMKQMDHPHIIKLYESFEDHRNLYLILELCTGGELFDKIIESGFFTECQAALLMQQMVKAINYMHEHRVCHRDLKPENFLFVNKDPIEKNQIKVIDFGLSKKFTPGQFMSTKAGTPYYVAPQVLTGKYDHLSDIWSLGVIMFVMLCGYPPFYGEGDQEILSKVRSGKFSFHPKDWKGISEDAKDLIRKMVTMDVSQRYSAEQALKHVWIENKAPKSAGISLQANFVGNLRHFRSQNKLKKAALHIIAGHLKEDEIKALRDTFLALDSNGDGQLTLSEMKEGIRKAGIKDIPADLQQILEDMDSDASGAIDYSEFLAATLDKHAYLQEDACWCAFRVFDKDGDGKISPEELKAVLGDDSVQNIAGLGAIGQMMQEVDGNGDGFIDFSEFMTMMRGAGKS